MSWAYHTLHRPGGSATTRQDRSMPSTLLSSEASQHPQTQASEGVYVCGILLDALPLRQHRLCTAPADTVVLAVVYFVVAGLSVLGFPGGGCRCFFIEGF